MKTEWLFNVYPQSKGKVLVVLWERKAVGDEKDRVQNPFSSGALSLLSREFNTSKLNYPDHVQKAKSDLAETAGAEFNSIKNHRLSIINFDDKDMIYSDWED